MAVLASACFSKSFQIEIDAFEKGVGAILIQDGHPIGFMSKKLSNAAEIKSMFERELMAVVVATQKWQHYLIGQ